MNKPGTWAINITMHANAGSNQAFTNMPAADTFLFSSVRHVQMVDLSGMSQVRLKVNKLATAGQTGATLTLRYSPVFSTTVSGYVDIGIAPVVVPVDNQNVYVDSGWVDLVPEVMNGDCYLAIVGTGGNGTLDPAFGTISVAFV